MFKQILLAVVAATYMFSGAALAAYKAPVNPILLEWTHSSSTIGSITEVCHWKKLVKVPGSADEYDFIYKTTKGLILFGGCPKPRD